MSEISITEAWQVAVCSGLIMKWDVAVRRVVEAFLRFEDKTVCTTYNNEYRFLVSMSSLAPEEQEAYLMIGSANPAQVAIFKRYGAVDTLTLLDCRYADVCNEILKMLDIPIKVEKISNNKEEHILIRTPLDLYEMDGGKTRAIYAKITDKNMVIVLAPVTRVTILSDEELKTVEMLRKLVAEYETLEYTAHTEHGIKPSIEIMSEVEKTAETIRRVRGKTFELRRTETKEDAIKMLKEAIKHIEKAIEEMKTLITYHKLAS